MYDIFLFTIVMKTLEINRAAAYTVVCAAVLFASCSKSDEKEKNPTTDPSQVENAIEMTYITDVLYYGDKREDGLYNYFLGLCDKPFIYDETGDEAAPEGGSLLYLDFYSATGAESWETAVLPDGEYIWKSKDFGSTDMEKDMLHGYFTRLQVMGKDGKQKSLDFNSGSVTVATGNNGNKLISGSFTLKETSEEISFRYDGKVVFGDPNEGSIGSIEKPVEFTASLGVGEYSEQYMPGVSTYAVTLTNAPVNENGDITGEGYMLALPFFNEKGGSLLQLAEGTYPVNDSYQAGSLEIGFKTLGPSGTHIIKINEAGEAASYSIITGGSATVSLTESDKYEIVADLTTDKGITVKCSYSGPIEFFNSDEPTEAESPTTLTGDLALNFETAEVLASYYGDYYGIGKDNWLIEIANTANDYITIDLLCDPKGYSTTLPAGQYNMSIDNSTGMMKGYVDKESNMTGTWYVKFDSNFEVPLEFAAAIDGTLKITDVGTQSLEINLVDSSWNLISGSYTGKIETFDESSKNTLAISKMMRRGQKGKLSLF